MEIIMELSNESKTLFIPLYGKALMSKKNLFIKDLKAEEIVGKVNFEFNKLKQSKWLSMYMALRSQIIDEICNKYILQNPNTTIIHLGCGLDSRYLRVKNNYSNWYDIDFESVINLRKEFFEENEKYKMIGKSVTDFAWIEQVTEKTQNVLIVAEGLMMYLSEPEIELVLKTINSKFTNVTLVFDAYSKKGVKYSKIKNPVKQMNASIKWGINNENDFLKLNQNLEFLREYTIKSNEKLLKGSTKFIFEKIYCGKFAESLYKIYEFRIKNNRK